MPISSVAPVLKKENRKKCVFHGFSSLTILAVVISLILIISGYLVTRHLLNQKRYIIVIDAGSTSSKISLYSYKDYPWRKEGYLEQNKLLKAEPGISEYIHVPKKASEILLQKIDMLYNMVNLTVPKSEIPIYMGATAGVRLTNISYPEETRRLIETIQDDLSNSGYEVINKKEDIKVLTGTEEGVFSWITANYLNNHFGKTTMKLVKPTEDSFGALDLGGASTQITFALNKNRFDNLSTSYKYNNDNIFNMSLYGKSIQLYSRSLLCLGKTKLRRHTFGSFIYDEIKKSKNLQTNIKVENPCLVKTSTESYKPIHFNTTECDNELGYPLFEIFEKTESTVKMIEMIGTGDYEKCRERIKHLLGRNGPSILGCQDGYCVVQGEKQPVPDGKFFAFAGYYYVTNHFINTKDDIVISKSEFLSKTKDLCENESSKLHNTALSNNEELDETVKSFCFDGIYIDYLLENFGFSDDQKWKQIRFVQNINKNQVSWALGFAIFKSGLIPFARPQLFIPYEIFLPLIIIFVALLLIILAIVICMRMRHKSEEGRRNNHEMESN